MTLGNIGSLGDCKDFSHISAPKISFKEWFFDFAFINVCSFCFKNDSGI